MNIKRMLKMLFTDPNSPEGLIIRAEKLEEEAKKPENVKTAENLLLYAETLRQLASKGWDSETNKKFIRENLRGY